MHRYHEVTHQRDYLALKCAKDVPRGSKFNPCPSSEDFAPILNFGSGLKTSDVFPSAVTMPHPEFIDAVLKNIPSAGNEDAVEKPLALDEDHLDKVVHAGDVLKAWDERVSVIFWRGRDVPFVPGMPFGADGLSADRVEAATCKSLLVDVLKMSEEDAAAYVAPNAANDVAQPPRKVTLEDIVVWTATAGGGAAAKTMTPRWRAVIMSAVARKTAASAVGEQSGASPQLAAELGEFQGESLATKGTEIGEGKAAPGFVDGAGTGGGVLTGQWLDAKFTALGNTKCASVLPPALVGEQRSHAQRQHYKYTLDVGGVQGTSWLGTLTAMSTASLVFRVDSPMVGRREGRSQSVSTTRKIRLQYTHMTLPETTVCMARIMNRLLVHTSTIVLSLASKERDVTPKSASLQAC